MARRWRVVWALAASLCWGVASSGNAQVTTPTPNFAPPGSYQRISGYNNPAMEYFGKSRPHFYVAQQAQRSLPAPPPAPASNMVQRSKPFSNVRSGPTISPYLGLDIRESGVGLPNYYAFVRPQLDQQQQNQVQQAQYQRLQRQFNTAVGGPAITGDGMPTTGHATQFMNPGGYYRQLR